MGLATVQRMLARLYTDSALRERFFADPQRVGQEFELSPEDIQQVRELSTQQVTLFANSLRNKRASASRRLLPLADQMLGTRFLELFRDYADTYQPGGIKKHLNDALHFTSFLERVIKEKSIGPVWLSDVIRYEQARVQASGEGRCFILRRFRYNVLALSGAVGLESEIAPRKRVTYVFWLRLFAHGRLYLFRL